MALPKQYALLSDMVVVSASTLLKRAGIIKARGVDPSPEDLSNANAVEVFRYSSGDVKTGKAVYDAQLDCYVDEYRSYTAAETLALAKVDRDKQVNNIKVTTTSGKIFDGNEPSQDRMTRAVAAGSPGETTQWRLADNSVATVTYEELKEALRLAGQAQTELWMI